MQVDNKITAIDDIADVLFDTGIFITSCCPRTSSSLVEGRTKPMQVYTYPHHSCVFSNPAMAGVLSSLIQEFISFFSDDKKNHGSDLGGLAIREIGAGCRATSACMDGRYLDVTKNKPKYQTVSMYVVAKHGLGLSSAKKQPRPRLNRSIKWRCMMTSISQR